MLPVAEAAVQLPVTAMVAQPKPLTATVINYRWAKVKAKSVVMQLLTGYCLICSTCCQHIAGITD